jgi:plasmid stabilization system protein ParE
MLGQLFRVIFSRKAQRRLNQINDYQEENVSVSNARKVSGEIRNAARKLERSPQAYPILPGTGDESEEIRYTKAWSYKLIFTVFKKLGEVVVVTIRHDKEDPDDVLDDL